MRSQVAARSDGAVHQRSANRLPHVCSIVPEPGPRDEFKVNLPSIYHRALISAENGQRRPSDDADIFFDVCRGMPWAILLGTDEPCSAVNGRSLSHPVHALSVQRKSLESVHLGRFKGCLVFFFRRPVHLFLLSAVGGQQKGNRRRTALRLAVIFQSPWIVCNLTKIHTRTTH